MDTLAPKDNLDSKFLFCNISHLSSRWQSWLVRGQSGILLMTSFFLIVRQGPLALHLLAHLVQIFSFHEAMEVAIIHTKSEDLRMWSWQMLVLANIYWIDPLLSNYS